MKKLFLFMMLLAFVSACTKDKADDPNTNNNNNNNNSSSTILKIIKGDGSGEIEIKPNKVPVCGNETSPDTFYSVRVFIYDVTNTSYDRLAIAFKKEPAPNDYPIIIKAHYNELPATEAGLNITYNSYNYIGTAGKVQVSLKVTGNTIQKIYKFENIPLDAGSSLGVGGTRLPADSKLSGTIVCE